MSQPDPYVRSFDFEGFQSGHPSTPLPGDKVNAELDALAAAGNDILDNLALIQRDDGELGNQTVGLDQLKPEISFGATAASTAIAAAEVASAAQAATEVAATAGAASAVDAAASAAAAAAIAAGLGAVVIGPGAATDKAIARFNGASGEIVQNSLATIDDLGALTAVGITSTGAVALSPANANVVLSPTGTGVVTINPATVGSINKMNIGATTRGTMAATTGDFNSTLGVTGIATLAALLDISGAAAGQIKFPAAQNPSANANTFDDYEEGTFTPAITFGGAAVGITYTTQTGRYTKLARAVAFQANIVLSSKGSSVGNALMTGLPFTADAFSYACVMIPGTSVWSTLVAGVLGMVDASATTMSLWGPVTNGSNQGTNTNFTNTSSFNVAGTYFTT